MYGFSTNENLSMDDWIQFQDECICDPTNMKRGTNYKYDNKNVFDVTYVNNLQVILSDVIEPVLMSIYIMKQNEQHIGSGMNFYIK